MGPNSNPFARQWQRSGLNSDLIISMIRNALPPTAALWTIYSTSLGQEFDIVGYLPMLITIFELPSLPRVQFLRSLFVTCVLNCIVACVCLLAGYCATQARLHTTPPGGDLSEYNGSAAAVTGVWMLFTVWAIQTWRVYHPQYSPSAAICTIYAEISIGLGTKLTTTADHVQLNTQLMQTYFLGHGFVTAANFFFFPISSRGASFKHIKSYLSLAGDVLSAEAAYVQSLERSQLLLPAANYNPDEVNIEGGSSLIPSHPHSSENTALRKAISSMSQLHSKLSSDISFAKKDIGWSTISGHDFVFIKETFRKLIVSLRGLAALMPIFQSLCEGRGWNTFTDSIGNANKLSKTGTPGDKERDEADRLEWKAIFGDLQGPVDEITAILLEGLRHVLICFGLDKPTVLESMFSRGTRNSKSDSEAAASSAPGSAYFIHDFENRLDKFHEKRGGPLRNWMDRIESDAGATEIGSNQFFPHSDERFDIHLEQMFVILFMQNLFHHVADILLELARFADSKSPNASKKHLVLPTSRQLWKLLRQMGNEDNSYEDFDNGLTQPSSTMGSDLGRVVSRRTIPKRRRNWKRIVYPVATAISRAWNIIGSHESFFGFRVAMAVMTVVIVGLLRPTQAWFFNKRALWALVFIPYSMALNAGESISMLLFRLAGSAAAVALALVNWYIVDGHPAGVIVFYFIYMTIANYFVVKYPIYGTVWRPALITHVIIISYSLQAKDSTTPQPPATTTQAYPVYLIGPYRYACTVVGVFAAFFWTIFPRVISSRSIARKKLGNALALLGSYYNCTHSTVGLWAFGSHGNTSNSSQQHHLNKTRDKLFSRQLVTLGSIREQINFSRFEPSMGIDFPAKLYQQITDEVDTMISYMNLIIYATTFLNTTSPSNEKPLWREHLSQAYRSADFSSHGNAALLSVLSMSVTSNEPLPPGLATPRPYFLARHVQKTNPGLLGRGFVEEKGFSEFAVVEIGASLMYKCLGRVLVLVEELVGVWEYGGERE